MPLNYYTNNWGDKNSISKIYKDIRQSRAWYVRLEANSGPRTKGVPTNNQRGRGSGPCLLWGGLDMSRHIVSTALLVRVQCFRKNLYKVPEGPSTRPIVFSMINGSYFRFRRCLTILELDKTKFASHWPSSTCWLYHRVRDSFRNIFLKRYVTKFRQQVRVLPEELSKCFPKLVMSVTLC